MAIGALPASAATGDLIQKAGTLGCISESGTGGECTDGTGINGANELVVSPDGKNVYSADTRVNAVAVLDRAADGTLTQKAGTAGCVSETGSDGACADGRGLGTPYGIAISPDGKNVYAAAYGSSSVAIFDRAADGSLTQKAGTAGCVSEDGSGGECADGSALSGGGNGMDVTVSPDGTSVYVAAAGSNAVAIFDRAANGTLTQKAGTAGCISDDGSAGACVDGTALTGAIELTVSPDGANVYVASQFSDSVAIFDRAASGALTQKTGTAGCISDDGSEGACVDGTGLNAAGAVVVSPDGDHVYVASLFGGVAIFDRAAGGALTQKTGTAGCITETGSEGACADGAGLAFASGIAASSDGQTIYVATNANAVVWLDRAADGALIQRPLACISETGSNGECIDGKALDEANGVAVSPDGKNVYVAASNSGSVAVFDRDSIPSGFELLTVSKAGTGQGTVTSQPVGIDCGSDCSEIYLPGTVVVLSATPAAGSKLVGFQGGGCGGTAQTCTTTVNEATTVTATFAPFDGTLTVTKAGAGQGTVTSQPAGINCGSDCSEVYPPGTVVVLSATPAADSMLTGFQGGGCGGTAQTCTTTVNDATAVTATFVQIPRTLTVAKSGNGQGTVTSQPVGINCGADCTQDYVHGTAVTLTATAAAGSTLTGFQGGGCGGAAHTCTTTLDQAQNVTVTFTKVKRTLTVASDGSGQGTVASAPAGINCGSDCTEDYDYETEVTLTANPAAGSTFAGFDGGGCSGETTCTVLLNQAQTVTGTFTRNPTPPTPPTPPAGGGGGGGGGGGSAQVGRTINGSGSSDRLVGTAGDDVINCGGGDDVVVAGAGNDVINCGAGNDTIDAGAGNDRVTGGSGNDEITGGLGNDRLSGDGGDDKISGGEGADTIAGDAGDDSLSGNEGVDVIAGGSGSDRISGNEANDRLSGGGGRDRISGNSGNDRLSGGSGDDRLFGNSGRDRLSGNSGRDVLTGGPGRDVLNGGPGKDQEKQ